MEIKVRSIDFNKELDRAKVVLVIHMLVSFALILLESISRKKTFSISFLLEFFVFIIIYKFFFESQRKRNYSFWGIAFIVLLYQSMLLLNYTFISYNILILYLIFLSLIFLFINIYIMSSPIFFPKVQWWEYDFRYRGDLKVKFALRNSEYEGRLTDLRRGAGCLLAFESIDLDEPVEIKINFAESSFKLKCQVVTIRQTIPGRPIQYGIKFLFDDNDTKKGFYKFQKLWRNHVKVKIRQKFSKVENEL